MNYYFFLDIQHPRQGPLSLAELAEKIDDVEVSLQTLVCKEGDQHWITLKEALLPSITRSKSQRSILGEWWYCITHSFCFHGRASRREFGSFTIINAIIQLILFVWIMSFTLEELSYKLDILNSPLLMDSDIEAFSQGFNIFEIPGIDLPINLFLAFTLLCIIPTFSASWRRLHDTGRSGLYALVIAVPFIGSFIYLFFTCFKSEARTNSYGPPPQQ